MIIINERHLRAMLREYVAHYNRTRPRRSLEVTLRTGSLLVSDCSEGTDRQFGQSSVAHTMNTNGWLHHQKRHGCDFGIPQVRLIKAAGVSGLGFGVLWRMLTRPRWSTIRKNLPRPGHVNTMGSWHALTVVVEGFAMLGARKEAGDLYPTVVQAIDATGTLLCFFASGLVQTVAGISAACGNQWDEAEAHFQLALRQAHEFPHRLVQPEVRRWYSRMLIDRSALGDREKARQLLNEAISTYREIGMPNYIRMAEAMLSETAN